MAPARHGLHGRPPNGVSVMARAIWNDQVLAESETFETVVDHYLDSFDVDRITPGTRRVGPTTHVEGRYIPMMVRREIYERQGHACAVPLCGNTLFLQHAHIQAHACGGSREADNLILVCSFHHMLFDHGVFHADPHPGNFLVREGPKLVILDEPTSGLDPVGRRLVRGGRLCPVEVLG